MPVTESIGRRQCIPILYTRGTHYEVGFDVGRNFASIIKSLIETHGPLQQEYLPSYATPIGRKCYEDTLNSVKSRFPQYVDELQGTADGAQVPFHKLFLLHMDNIILSENNNKVECQSKHQPIGCSSICVNQAGQEILGHTEDALSETLNHFYFVSAHIISDKPQGRWNVKEEKFTSLCYAGHLPGYTMSYNYHGLVFSINTISAENLQAGKIPRHFLTRALLSAENFNQAEAILKDKGCGAGDGCSINLTFLNGGMNERIFYNIEMAPATSGDESQLSVVQAKRGEFLTHANCYKRLVLKQNNDLMLESSYARQKVFDQFAAPKSMHDVVQMLGDVSDRDNPVFRADNLVVATIAVGIFDCVQKTWSLYADNPKTTSPLVVLPLDIK